MRARDRASTKRVSMLSLILVGLSVVIFAGLR